MAGRNEVTLFRPFFSLAVCAGLLIFLSSCSRPPEDRMEVITGRKTPASRMAPGPEVSPSFHQPKDWWRRNHGKLTGPEYGPHAGLLSIPLCLQCHSPDDSCNICHAFIAAPLQKEDMP